MVFWVWYALLVKNIIMLHIIIRRACLSKSHLYLEIHHLHYSNSPINVGDKISSYMSVYKRTVNTKFNDIFSWYEKFIGIDEVRLAQNRVIEAQNRFASAQAKRREINSELNVIRNKIKDIQDEVSVLSRGEEKYLLLITQEHKFLKEEIRLVDKFNMCEREEREYFNTFTSAVKESHERERIHTNSTKYLSIIGSVIGTLIGILGSTVNNFSKFRKMEDMMLEVVRVKNADLQESYNQLETKLDNILLNVSNSNVYNNDVEFLKQITLKLNEIQNVVINHKSNSSDVKITVSYLSYIKSQIFLLLSTLKNYITLSFTKSSTHVKSKSTDSSDNEKHSTSSKALICWLGFAVIFVILCKVGFTYG